MSQSPQDGPRSPTERSAPGTPLLVAIIVLLCIAAIVYLARRNNGGGESDEPDLPTTQVGPVSCTAPPPAPSQPPQTYNAAPDPALAEAAVWTATLETNCGDITLELYGDKAPQTVASFLFLAREDFWAGSPCHRLTTAGIFVLQCGDPTGSGTGGPGYGFGIENAPANGKFPVGTLAMARTQDPNSNGSQFFIVYKNTTLPTEGGGYSIFGRVTDGMEIVDAIAKEGVRGGAPDGPPAQPISIVDVSVQEQ